jgi:hypothetical protein
MASFPILTNLLAKSYRMVKRRDETMALLHRVLLNIGPSKGTSTVARAASTKLSAVECKVQRIENKLALGAVEGRQYVS